MHVRNILEFHAHASAPKIRYQPIKEHFQMFSISIVHLPLLYSSRLMFPTNAIPLHYNLDLPRVQLLFAITNFEGLSEEVHYEVID